MNGFHEADEFLFWPPALTETGASFLHHLAERVEEWGWLGDWLESHHLGYLVYIDNSITGSEYRRFESFISPAFTETKINELRVGPYDFERQEGAVPKYRVTRNEEGL